MAGDGETSSVPAGSISHRHRRPTTQHVAQENSIVIASNKIVPVVKKKKGRTSTKLKRPPNGVLIPIKPHTDCYFLGDKGIAGQVTALLKYEYPSIIKENKDGVETKRHAFEWEDYCIVDPPDEQTGEISESAADQLKHAFWSIYKLADDTPENRVKANFALENLARKQLKQMMYQARKDAVKKYCNEIGEPISDSKACGKLLTTSQYIQGRLEWCKDAEAWESLCKYWCFQKFLTSRGLGQLSRKAASLDDVAQNRGGSRNFVCTKEYIVLYANAGLSLPEDLENDSMEDSDHVNQSSPSVENGGNPLTTSRAREQSDTSSSGQDHTTRAQENSPIFDE